jgi:hypothetical protein
VIAICRLVRSVFRAQYLSTDGSHKIVCTTPADIPVGYHSISLSYNGQEWDSRSEVPFLVYKAPFISHVEPAATATSYGSFYPGGSSVTIFGKHFLEAARLGQGAAWDVKFGDRFGTVSKSSSDFEIVVTPPAPERAAKVVVGLRLLKVDFPAPDVSFEYLDWAFTPAGTCFNGCGGSASAGVRGNCYSGTVWDPLARESRPGPVCNCSAHGFQGYACGQEAVVAHLSPRSGPLQGGTRVSLYFLGLDLLLGRRDRF